MVYAQLKEYFEELVDWSHASGDTNYLEWMPSQLQLGSTSGRHYINATCN